MTTQILKLRGPGYPCIYIYIIFTPNLGLRTAIPGREKEQSRFESTEGAAREHEPAQGSIEGAAKEPTDEGDDMPLEAPPDSKGTDYRNHGVLWDDIWPIDIDGAEEEEKSQPVEATIKQAIKAEDLNDRGRDRPVETQSDGLTVVKAA